MHLILSGGFTPVPYPAVAGLGFAERLSLLCNAFSVWLAGMLTEVTVTDRCLQAVPENGGI